ncbi:MAG: SDR family oxidoreductase [Candidatus Omnitrophica bacterium]|nr:SDR family oxidoreductase [Candidatus Omnitrophota bacterium]
MGGPLEGMRVVVTGSGRGLGRFYALHLAERGADVIVHDISEEAASVYHEASSLTETVVAIRAMGRRSTAITADLTDGASAGELAKKAIKFFGQVDVLINNAGGDIVGTDPAAAGGKPSPNDAFIPEAQLIAVLNRNLLTCMHTCRVFLPSMIAANRGKIINISSVAAIKGTAGEIAYAVSKAGVVHYTRCLATQLCPRGITVNCVAPGPTRSGRFLATLAQRGPTDTGRLASSSPLERLGEPEDVARVIEFFCGPLSNFVNGQVLVVDGGQHCFAV